MAQHGNKPRFIRKNGRIIPVGGKKNAASRMGAKKKAPAKKSRVGAGQSKDTVKKRIKGIKKAQKNQSVFKAAAFSGAVGAAIGAMLPGFSRSPNRGKVALVVGGATGTLSGIRKHQGNKKRAKTLKGLRKRLREF